MSLPGGYKVVKMSPKKAELCALFKGHPGNLQLDPDGWILPPAMEKYGQAIKDFPLEEGDVIVMTMPKSGTTWTQEIVWTMKNNPNFDHPLANTPLHLRSPILEADTLIDQMPDKGSFMKRALEGNPNINPDKGVFLQIAKDAPRPRVFKSHLTFPLVSDTALTNAKIVYTIRDPRDMCISNHHHCKLFKYEGFEGTFEQFVDSFLEDAYWYGPYWAHVKAAWERRHLPNLHIIFFEKMKKNPKEECRKLSKFLGCDLTEEQLDKIVHYTSFAEMKKRDTHVIEKSDYPLFLNMLQAKNEGGFFRQGTSGGWKKVLSQEQKDRFDAWIEKHCPDKEIMECINNP